MRTPRILTAALLPLLAACGASVQATPFAPGRYAPRPADAPVRMYSTKVPACPYTELGLLRAERDTGLTPWRRVVDAFVARARQMGGDGVIVKQGVDIRGSEGGELVSEDVLTGTVIRLDQGCEG